MSADTLPNTGGYKPAHMYERTVPD